MSTAPTSFSSNCQFCNAVVAVVNANGLCLKCSDDLASNVVPVTGYSTPAFTGTSIAPLASFGDYKIESELARGGMGIVYIARQISLNRRVALKMISTAFAGESELMRFRSEARNAATLEHPNIVPVYEFGELFGQPFFTMKLIQGRSLAAEIRRLVLDPRKGVAILAAVARAVNYAHRRGILHRDLKPANILIDEAGVPHVTDFGLAMRLENPDGLTEAGTVMGTPQYMSPEQASGSSKPLTTASDLYSVGAILYELLTLRPPFQADTPVEILIKVNSEDPVPPRAIRRVVDRDLETICMKCLEKDPAQRYRSAEELAEELERWLRHEPILARPHSFVERAIKWVRRRPAAAASVLLAAALVLSLVGAFWHNFDVKRQAELQKVAEHQRSADDSVKVGHAALLDARKFSAEEKSTECERALVEAEDRFRAALITLPEHVAARDGLREAALVHFGKRFSQKDWRGAREKLVLAHDAGLPDGEYDLKKEALAALESKRESHIRARVSALMKDAASFPRTVLYEMAVYELISLKDPLTVTLLSGHLSNPHPDCRRLALGALAWVSDDSLVPKILPYIQPTTPDGKDNPQGVQEAALNAVCVLSSERNVAAFDAINARIAAEPRQKLSLLFERIKIYYQAFARRVETDRTTPQTAAEWIKRAETFTAREEHHEALDSYDHALFLDPRNAAALYARAASKRTVKDFDGALADLAVARKLQAPAPVLLNEIGSIKTRMRDYDGAIQDFDQALDIDPQNVDAFANRAYCKTLLNDHKAALVDYDTAVKLAPENANVRVSRGQTRMKTADINGAMADFKHALSVDARNTDAHFGLATAHEAHGNTKAALSEYDKVIEIDPRYENAFARKGVLDLKLSHFADAIDSFNKADILVPDSPKTFYFRAMAKSKLGDTKAAVADFDRAVILQPSLAEAWVARGTLRAEMGDMDGAQQDIEKGLQIDSRKTDAWVNLAIIHFKKGNEKAALENLARAEEINPKAKEIYGVRSGIHYERGRIQEALEDLTKALELEPRNTKVAAKIESIRAARRDAAPYLEALRREIEKKPDDADVLFRCAGQLLESADESLRDPAKALPLAQKAASLSHDSNPEYLDTLALAFFKNGKQAEAIAAQKKALSVLPADAKLTQRAMFEAHLRTIEGPK